MPNNATQLTGISGSIQPAKPLSGSIATGSGTADHTRLYNRDLPDQHPMEAITGLTEELSGKLDSETIQPVINQLQQDIKNAVGTKAKGMYHDLACKLNKKPYWYLTSDVDINGQGTIDSVIAGPYDLGAGGGGGGGGGVTDIKLTKTDWPSNVAVGSDCLVTVTWSSTRDDEPTGRGTLYCYVADKLIETRAANQGQVTFNLKDYIISGENKIEIKVIDAYSATKNVIGSVAGVTLLLSSNFEDDQNYTGQITFTYIPTGAIRKYVHFLVDDVEIGTATVDTTGEQQTKFLPAQSHGAHTLRVYFTVNLEGEEVRSNELFYDLICYEPGNDTPIIACPFNAFEQEQYASFLVRYRVYTPGRNMSDVKLISDGQEVAALTIGTTYQSWECRFDEIGEHIIKIQSGNSEKTFTIHVHESSIHVDPVTDALELWLTSYGRSNSEPLEYRAQWVDESGHGITSDLTGFNWASNGWVLDDNGNTVLRVSGDARVVIKDYKPFATDFLSSGKTFEFELATRDVKNYEAQIFSCLDGADTLTSSQIYAGEDTRTKRFIIEEIDNNKFISKVLQVKGVYLFVYNGSMWDLDGTLVSQEQLFTEYGIKLAEIDLDPSVVEPSHYIAGDRISIYYTVSGRGFYITPQLAKLQSRQASLSTQYKEEDRVRLAFVVEKQSEGTADFKTRLIYMYINGVLSGVSRYSLGDSFLQIPPAEISIGSNEATVDIYNIRIYNNNLTRKQIVTNWIADTKDPIEKARRYKHNDNYDDIGQISVEKIAGLGNLPYMIVSTPELPSYKKDRKYAAIQYINPGDPKRDFTSEEARMDVQGTSSQYYYKKNFKIKYEQGFYDNNLNWSEHYKLRGDKSKKEKTFTYKADVASSEGANNVALVRYFEDTKNWYSPPELYQDPEDTKEGFETKDRIRVGIDGLPIVMFHDAGNGPKFYGKMNFNNDKGNDRTFGFENGDECWEFINNTTPAALFQTQLTDDNWSMSFEARFPEEAGADEHPYGTLPSERTKLKEVVDWVYSTTGKITKFRNEFTNYFDLQSSLFYYLFTELFLMVDSRAKNAMLAYYRSRQPGDGGDKWFWLPYDMDTALGINNEGLLVFNFDKEDTDLQEGANIFNGQNSVFWCNLRDAFTDELATLYRDLRAKTVAGWNFDGAEQYFEDHQAAWSENIFNEDAYSKYLEPYILNKDASYLGMAQGSKLEQRRWWLYNRFKYLDSKYGTGSATKNTLMLRAYQKPKTADGQPLPWKITPYINCYVSAIFDQDRDNLTTLQRAQKGIAVDVLPPSGWDPAGVDSVVVLRSADLLQDVGDLSAFKPGYANFSAATKLQRLQIGNAASGYSNDKLVGITVGANRLLTYIDARNCTRLGAGEGDEVTPTIELSSCPNIEEAYFDNTSISGINFPVGGNLKIVHLPNTLTSLTIRNHPNIEEFVLAGTQNLVSLWLEDIPASVIDPYTYIMEMPESASVRLIDIRRTFDTAAQVTEFFIKLNTMRGLDARGSVVDRAQVTGIVYVSEEMTYANYNALQQLFPEVTVMPTAVKCTVNFFNYVNGDTEEYELYRHVVTTMGTQIREVITSPHRSPSIQHVYTFDNWYYERGDEQQVPFDPVHDTVNSDLAIYPKYSASIRQYTARFDKQTAITAITVSPSEEVVDYNTKLTAPVVTVPEEIPMTLSGWYTTAGTKWDFETDMLLTDTVLFARWTEPGIPSVDVSTTVNCNTFKAICHDDEGLVGWAVTTSDTLPSEWVPIDPPQFDFEYNYSISTPEKYYFWVRDSAWTEEYPHFHYDCAYRQGCKINKVPSTGIEAIQLKYNDEVVETTAIFANMNVQIHVDVNSNYENLQLQIQDSLGTRQINNDTVITILSDTEITATVTPKNYTAKFILNKEHARPVEDQIRPYNTVLTEPLPQAVAGDIIEGWYTTPTPVADDHKWNFAVDTIQVPELRLYAHWVRDASPSIYTITVKADKPTVGLHFTSEGGQIGIHWGDSASSDLEYQSADAAHHIEFTHIYEAVDASYTISIYAASGTFAPGYWNSFDTTKRYETVVPITGLQTVEFAFDVSEISAHAFDGAINLSRLVLTDYLLKIGSFAFRNCSALHTIDLPINLLTIGESAFEWSGIESVKIISNNLARIPQSCFDHCTSLRTVQLPDSVIELGQRAFAECTMLRGIVLPNNLQYIRAYCFAGCASLLEIIIPPTVKYLGSQDSTDPAENDGSVFSACSMLEHVQICGSQTELAKYCFNACGNLRTVGPITPDKAIVHDMHDDDHTVLTYLYNIEYAWDTKIPDYAFCYGYRDSSLSSVVFADTITELGDSAFYYAFYAVTTELTIPRQIKSIGDECFVGGLFETLNIWTNVSEFGIASLQYIGKNAFSYCLNLKTVNLYIQQIETQLSSIEDAWFNNSTALLNLGGGIHIPKTIELEQDARRAYGPYWNICYNGVTGEYATIQSENDLEV